MDSIDKVRSCLGSWTGQGEVECRQLLITGHSNLPDPNASDVITTVYNTLVKSLIDSGSSPAALTPSALTAFLQSVQHGLPSSSANVDSPSCEHFLVDAIWSLDLEIEDVAGAVKPTHGASEQSTAESPQAQEMKRETERAKDILVQFVHLLLNAGLVTARVCRERFEVAFSVSVGLLGDKATFERRERITRTRLFYRQNKFNLLREQTEGYSKLNSELTSNLAPPHAQLTGAPIESYAAVQQRARVLWKKVISLIGYFDLDPNRALDIILDVFSVTLGSHFSFFLALLNASPWAGSSTFPPAEVVPPEMDFHGKSIDEILNALDPGYVASSPDDSPSVMAQVLGFKFVHYQSSEAGDSTPKQLYLMAALLIRERLITLEDLLPHLNPSDDGMNAAEREYKAALRTRISGSKQNALAMAAPLESSTPSMSKPKPTTTETTKAENKLQQNQRAGLLSALLAVGALRPAFSLISKHRWLVDAYPENADLIIRILKHSTAPLYESLLVNKEKRRTCNQPRSRYGPTGVAPPLPKKPCLTYWAPTPPSTSIQDPVFFFPRWSERIPLCTSLEDLIDFVEPFLSFIGPLVSRDVIFVTKLLRLARTHLQSTVTTDESGKSRDIDESHPVCQAWYMMLRRYLLPSLSLVSGNAVFSVDVWGVVRLYSPTSRWRLYGEWRACYQLHGELRVREAQCNTESRAILRRLSHQSIDALAGPIAKLAHSNPTIFFTIAINQICSYENLAEVVILALKYLTTMGLEVLVFILLDALSNEDRDRVKPDGVNISDWLQSLAAFTGMFFRRYLTDLTPVLRYIVHQLLARQTSEITVLRELILKMAGIEPLPDLSDAQVIAMAGGPALRIEAVASKTRGARLEEGDAVLKAPQRLGKYLLDSNLALPLLIEVAQQRQSCVFTTQSDHLKSLSGLYDATHGVLCQYLELLTTPGIVSPQEYATRVLPNLGELGSTYGISAPICMQIIRPVLHAKLLASTLSMSTEETEKRLKAEMIARKKPASSRTASPAVNGSSTAAEDGPDVKPAAETAGDENAMAVDAVAAPVVPASPWLPELAELFDDIRKIVSSQVLDQIGIGFYTTFWQLSTYDLSPPLSKYEEEMASLKAASRAEDLAIGHAERSSDRSLRQKAPTFRQRRDRYNDYAQTLSQEAKDQSIMRTFTIRRMSREKQHWFLHQPKAFVFANMFIEHCLQPRCLLSPMDAEFCSQIVKVLQVQGTPGFPTLAIYDKLLGEHIKAVVFSCSEYEARNYGRFLRGVLTDLYRWYQDEQAYLQDSRTKTGGRTILHPGFQIRFAHKTVTSDDLLKWIDLRRALKKWHIKLAKSLAECIVNKEFMHVYNAILVLKEVLPVFPLFEVSESGHMLFDSVERLLETEQRGDLKIICTTYLSSLKSRQALWAKPRAAPPSAPNTHRTSTPVNGIPATNGRTAPHIVAPTPSAPRSQLINPGPTSTKLAMDSIPRPEVVKRVRPDGRNGASPQPGDVKPQSPAISDARNLGDKPTLPAFNELRQSENLKIASGTSTPRVSSPLTATDSLRTDGRPLTPKQAPSGSQGQTTNAPAFEERTSSAANMPPPANPSLTTEAQELRETAKQTINRDKPEDRNPRTPTESRNQPSQQSGSSSSHRERSQSPTSRPGTRNASVESRHSADRSRSERSGREDSKRTGRSDQEGSTGSRDRAPSRRESTGHSRRDRYSERDERDRDRDRGRDRHGDRDRDKDRDHRDRERERERRDKARDGDDRDRDGRKERERDSRAPSGPSSMLDDRGLPSKPRHPDESLKRRRGHDDDDRSSKRGTRKDHRDSRDDRLKRSSEKDGADRPRDRDSDRRHPRRDRDEGEGETSPVDKSNEKRPPDAPKNHPPSTPSGPRAMASSDSRGNRDRLTSSLNGQHDSNSRPRLGEKDSSQPNQGSSPTTTPLRGDQSFRSNDERDGGKKRTISEREPDGLDSPLSAGLDSQPPKRPRINRNRYGDKPPRRKD